jgi:hypothetical protein
MAERLVPAHQGVRARGREPKVDCNQTSTGPLQNLGSKFAVRFWTLDESRHARFEWLCHIARVDVASDNVASRGPLRNH